MQAQTSLPEGISSAESEALGRYVHDLEIRMKPVSELLKDRGTPTARLLALSILNDLRLLGGELTNPVETPESSALATLSAHTQ